MSPAMAMAMAVTLIGCLVASQAKTVHVYGTRYRHPAATKEFMRTYVKMEENHDASTPPTAVGMELTNGYVRNANRLPFQNMIIPEADGPFNFTFNEQRMMLPKVGKTPFNWVMTGYNLKGHPPVGIYDVPHFDFHFMFNEMDYWYGPQAFSPANMGPCFGANPEVFARAQRPVYEQCYPTNDPAEGIMFAHVGNFVWEHGNHNYNLMGPEFPAPGSGKAPAGFNQTLIYGVFDGKVQFMEPMITRALLMKKGNVCWDVPALPKEWPTARSIPTRYCILNDGKTTKVEFNRFKSFPAGCTAGKLTAYWPTATAPPLPPACVVTKP